MEYISVKEAAQKWGVFFAASSLSLYTRTY